MDPGMMGRRKDSTDLVVTRRKRKMQGREGQGKRERALSSTIARMKLKTTSTIFATFSGD